MRDESTLSFAQLAAALRIGREIEFVCGGKQYSITNSGGYWYFCCDSCGGCQRLCLFEEKEKLVALAGVQSVGGLPLREVFDRTLYERDSLCIL